MSPKNPVQSLRVPGVGVSGVSLEWWIGAIVPIAMIIWLLWMSIKGERGYILPAVVPMITASEISSRIAEVVRNIVMSVFEVATPIVNTAGVALIILGLLLWFGARQEFLGWRLLAAGVLMLIFMNVVAPMLLSFI
jgi:hypothetical protein